MDIKKKLVTSIVMGVSALVVSKAIETGWKLATGNDTPKEDDTGHLIQLLVFAGVSAMAVAGAQRAALKQTNKFIAARL